METGLLTIMAIIVLIAGVVLIAFGILVVAGMVWSVTALISCIVYSVKLRRVKI